MSEAIAWTIETIKRERPEVRVYDTTQRRECAGRIWIHKNRPHLAQIVYHCLPADWGRNWPRRVIWVTWTQLQHALNAGIPLTA